MATVSLYQSELDAAYHKAVFDCDQALADIIRRFFKLREEQMATQGVPLTLWNAIRDDLHNALAQAFNDCEIQHMGGSRYDALIASLWARTGAEKAKH